jgi:hypothetical protein
MDYNYSLGFKHSIIFFGTLTLDKSENLGILPTYVKDSAVLTLPLKPDDFSLGILNLCELLYISFLVFGLLLLMDFTHSEYSV